MSIYSLSRKSSGGLVPFEFCTWGLWGLLSLYDSWPVMSLSRGFLAQGVLVLPSVREVYVYCLLRPTLITSH